MDLNKLEKVAKLTLSELPIVDSYQSDGFYRFPEQAARFRNLMMMAQKTLPDYSHFFATSANNISYISHAKSVIEHLLKIIAIERQSSILTEDMKIFDSAEEKMKQANICFQKEDYPSALNNLNTTLELVLKDKVGIPTTITNINTSNIIDILAKYKIEPFLYLLEARKYVLNIDNKIKHTGYSPSKIDCINGMKAIEGLISKLRSSNIILTEEQRNKIFDGI